jgi:hypothetical protein
MMGSFVVFDLIESANFINVHRWMNDVQSIARPDAVVVLISNKLDLADSRLVSWAAAEELATKLGCRYFETSARTGDVW